MYLNGDIFDTFNKFDMIEIVKESNNITEINFYFPMSYNAYDKIGISRNTVMSNIYTYSLRLYKNGTRVRLSNNAICYISSNYDKISKIVAKLHNKFKINQN